MSGWVTAELVDLAVRDGITDGPFGSNLKTAHYTTCGPRVIRLQNIGDAEFIDAKAHVSPEHFDRLRKHEARSGDLVVALLGGVLPRACTIPPTLGPAIVKADCARVRIDDGAANAKFVCFALNRERLRKQIAEIVHGVGRPRITLRELKALEVPLAPRREQERIVAAIEEQLSRVDAGVAALERVKKELARYRASVLKAACEGRLVPTEAALARDEGRSYEPARELLARILTERRARWDRKKKYVEPAAPVTSSLPALPEGWVRATVEQLSTRVQYGHTASATPWNGGVRFLRITDIQDRAVDWSAVPSCEISADEIADLRLTNGDLVFARTGATVGKSFQLRAPFPEAVFASYLIRISPIDRTVGDWLRTFFESPEYWLQIRESSAGIGQPNVNGSKLQALRVPLPPLAEQHRIVAEVERRFSIADEVAATVESGLARAARLRQSILKRAFEGKLVPQDPNDEPASVLLARIRADREAGGEKKPKRKRARA